MLQVRKMPSGGRGEYEVVGHSEEYAPEDLQGRRIFIQTTYGVIDSGVALGGQGDKKRLRIVGHKGVAQLTPQIACLMLLPAVTRAEDRVTRSQPVILEDRYILDFSFEVVSIDQGSALIEVRELIARSADIKNDALKTHVIGAQREQQIRWLLESLDSTPDMLRAALVAWRERVLSGGPLIRNDAKLVRELISALSEFDELYIPGTDPLPYLMLHAGLSVDVPIPPSPASITSTEPELRRRAEHAYRLTRARAASSVGFKRALRLAYDSTCAFCGFRAPSRKNRSLPGVDAAHILPYGEFDLDRVDNGLVLCKLHHWAFDSRLLTLRWTDPSYFVDAAPDLDEVLEGDRDSTLLLRSVVGPIPVSRLPSARAAWPNPFFIHKLYEF